MFNTLKYDVHDGIAYVTLCRPDSLNALSEEVLDELYSVFEIIDNDPETGAVILTGEGRAFAAGADISQMAALSGLEGQELMKQGACVMDYIENISKPVIAAVNGYALGGGCELAMACDIRIASEKAVFGQPEVNLGIIPGFGGTQRLPRLVGKGMGKYMIMTGEYISADRALAAGLAEIVVPHESLLDTCRETASKIMSKAPIAVRTAKHLINSSIMLDLPSGIAMEGEACAAPFTSSDRIEGMKAFLEKRTPKFKNK